MSAPQFLIPYAYDYIQNEKGAGTRARCDVLIDIAEMRPSIESWFVLTAGFTKMSPAAPTEEQKESLAEQMKKYILSQLPDAQVEAEPRGFGTIAETHGAIKIIERIALREHIARPVVWVSSNPGHLYRVWLCWKFLAPPLWEVNYVGANHSFGSTKEICRECVKFALTIPALIALRCHEIHKTASAES
jgi:hypothetical protein